MRRMIALGLSLCLLLLAALPAHGEELATLDILSQYDSRLANHTYTYDQHRFSARGCMPASITNALLAVFGQETDSLGLLLEVMTLLAPYHRPKLYPISVNGLSYLLDNEQDARYPILNGLLEKAPCVLHLEKLLCQSAEVLEALARQDGPVLLTGRATLREQWGDVVSLAGALQQAGYGGARLAMAALTVGTPSTQAPFRTSAAGHYAAVYLQVDEFCRTGAFYLLDSYPRAIAGESWGPGTPYSKPYPFCEKSFLWEFTAFNNTWTVERVAPAVVRVTPSEAASALAASQEEGQAMLALLPEWLQLVPFYGHSYAFLLSPGRE